MHKLENIHVNNTIEPIISPDKLKTTISIDEKTSEFVIQSRLA